MTEIFIVEPRQEAAGSDRRSLPGLAAWIEHCWHKRARTFDNKSMEMSAASRLERKSEQPYHGRENLELLQNADDGGVGYGENKARIEQTPAALNGANRAFSKLRLPRVSLTVAFLRRAIVFLALTFIGIPLLHAAPETIDLPALAQKSRPAVLLLSVLDSTNAEIAEGTGFVISADGRVVTNCHVIAGAASMVAKGENGAFYQIVGVLAQDGSNDIAILKLAATDLPFLTLGDSTKEKAGQRIAVIGSPLGLEGTLSEGIISANRTMDGQRVLQISAPISHGSSGSPVLGANGEVLGVAKAFLANGQSLNLAVPVEAVKSLLPPPTAKPVAFSASSPTPDLESASPPPEPQVDPNSAFFDDPKYQLSNQAYEEKDYTKALKLANELVKYHPGSDEALVQRAFALAGLNLDSDAIGDLKAAIKLNSQSKNAWGLLASEYYSTKQWTDALAAAKNAIKLNPDDGLAWADFGGAQLGLKDFQNAETSLEQAVKIKPDSRQAWNDLAGCYRQEKLWAMVTVVQQRASNAGVSLISPNTKLPGYADTEEGEEDVWSDPDYKAAQSAFLDKDTTGAIKHYEKALTRFPDSLDILIFLSFQYGQLHELDRVLAVWQQASLRLPNDQTVISELAGAYLAKESNGEAIRCFRSLTSPKSDDLCLLAVALINVKNYAEAADVLNQAQKLNPTDACPWWLRGCSCYIQKQYPEAITALKQAVSLDANQPQPWRELAKVYGSLGRVSDAATSNRKAKSLESAVGFKSSGDSLTYAALNLWITNPYYSGVGGQADRTSHPK